MPVVSHLAVTWWMPGKMLWLVTRCLRFGGILITNTTVNKEVAEEINKIFFEVIIAPAYDADALEVLKQRKIVSYWSVRNARLVRCSSVHC